MPSGVFSLKQQAQARSEGAWPGSPPTTLNYLVVAGGGGGGKANAANSGAANGGGGGAGGLLQGVIAVIPGNSYTVTVGAGGTGGGGSDGIGADGANSVFGSITSTGGGGGGNSAASGANAGRSGGSGGGAGGGATSLSTGGSGTSGQGNAGGGNTYASSGYGTGGGGGAGTIGLTGTSSVGGNGGAGIASDISGVRVVYAGGGGGSTYNGNGTAGSGGAGGGGAGTINGSTAGGAGGGNTGGGGGGGSFTSPSTVSNGGNGGSGIVIVSYPGTTQWFTGGTLSYANGNVIHTFYSSGTLAPTAPSNFVNTDYQIARSLRFNAPDSTYLNRTPASATNRKTWTWSCWVKRANISRTVDDVLFDARSPAGGTNHQTIHFGTGDNIRVRMWNGSSYSYQLNTTPLFRDVSAWYHIVVALDTTQPIDTNRLKIYVNGTQVTAFSTATYPAQNFDGYVNDTGIHNIGVYGFTTAEYSSCYMTEINFIDGQALSPAAFGYVNPNTGVWSPLKFVGTYGTNGFYLNFSDNSNTTAATLGKDYSGNGNNWTPNNFSVTAGAGNDSLVDSPTAYGTDTGAGGEVRGNYATLNPINKSSIFTFANGNLDVTSTTGYGAGTGTIGMSSGKWYWEVTITTVGSEAIGIAKDPINLGQYGGQSANSWIYTNNGQKANNDSFTSYGNTYTTGDVIGVGFNADDGELKFYKNGTVQNSGTAAFTGLTSGPYYPTINNNSAGGNTTSVTFNFGQRPFAYTAPSGFKALVNQNLPTPTIGATSTTQADNYFNTVLYTGDSNSTGATRSVTGVGFQPDFVWLKTRTDPYSHQLYDAVRGTGSSKNLSSDRTAAEGDSASLYGYVSAFQTDGFQTTNGSSGTDSGIWVNALNENFVAWNWKANGAGSTNTAGTITSTVSANTTAGFSIVTFTGNGTAGATVGHGLGVAPSMIIVKSRGNARNWLVYHASVGATQFLQLDTTIAATSSTTAWNDTAPSSTVFTLGTSSAGNESGITRVAYCFAPVAGYSAFGSYTGNGSADGPFIYTGFRPAYVMIKQSSAAGEHWVLLDNKRNTENVVNKELYANLANAEGSNAGNATLDFLSNGFKIRTSNAGQNTNAATYIYAVFAEVPQKFSLAR